MQHVAVVHHGRDIAGRDERRRIVLDDQRRAGDAIVSEQLFALVARRLARLAIVEDRAAA